MTEQATLGRMEQDRLEDAARGLVEQLVAAVQAMELKRPGTAFTSWEAGVARRRGDGPDDREALARFDRAARRSRP